LALWKVINEEDNVLILKKIKARNFPADFCTRNFLEPGLVSRYFATQFIVTLSLGHSEITSCRPWSPIAKGNHLDHDEKIPNFFDDWQL
jgi:hypothetical protein